MSIFILKMKRLSISKKIFLIYIGLILIPICIIIYIYFSHISNIYKKEALDSANLTARQTAYNISHVINGAENATRTMTYNYELVNVLKRNSSDRVEQIEEYNYIYNILTGIESSEEIFRARLFVSPDKFYSREQNNIFSLNEIHQKPWYNDLSNSLGQLLWTNTYVENYLGIGEKNIISCVRKINDPWNINQLIAVFSADIDEKRLCDLINIPEFERGEYCFIVNSHNEILSHTDKSLIGTKADLPENASDQTEGNCVKNRSGEFVITQNIPGSSWKLIMIVPDHILLTNRNVFVNIVSLTIIILAISLSVILLIFSTFTGNVMRQINELLDVLDIKKNYNNKRQSFRLFYDEIGRSIANARTLIKDSYDAKIGEREARLQALQAQINPHFLYNALDSINWTIKKQQLAKAEFLVSALSKYFRLSLNKGKDIVCLADEVELAKVYIDIQKQGLEKSFDAFFDVEQPLLNCSVPKLILQPIIENAITHGIQKKQECPGIISVCAYRIDEYIIIEITDNGIGISEENISKLLNKQSAKSYGLYNVNQRIKLFSGDQDCGITIESEENEYTTVILKIKIRI